MKLAHYILIIIIFIAIQMLNTITRLDFTTLFLSFVVVYLLNQEYDTEWSSKEWEGQDVQRITIRHYVYGKGGTH